MIEDKVIHFHIEQDFNLLDMGRVQSIVYTGMKNEIEFISTVYGLRVRFRLDKSMFETDERTVKALEYYRQRAYMQFRRWKNE